MGEQAVEADRHAEAGDQVHDAEQDEVVRAHAVAPEESDGGEKGDERDDDGEQIRDPGGSGHTLTLGAIPRSFCASGPIEHGQILCARANSVSDRRATRSGQGGEHFAVCSGDPEHLAVAHDRGLADVGRGAVLDLGVERLVGAVAGEVLLERLPVDGVVDVPGEVEVGGAEAPRSATRRPSAARRGGAAARARDAPPPTARRRSRSPRASDAGARRPDRGAPTAPRLRRARRRRRARCCAAPPPGSRRRCTTSPPRRARASAGTARRAGAGAARSTRRRRARRSRAGRRRPRPAASARSCPGARGPTGRRRPAPPARDR